MAKSLFFSEGEEEESEEDDDDDDAEETDVFPGIQDVTEIKVLNILEAMNGLVSRSGNKLSTF